MNTTVHEIFIFGAKVVSFFKMRKGCAKNIMAVNVFRKGTTTSGEADNYTQVRESTFSVWIGNKVLQYYSITVLQKRLLQKKWDLNFYYIYNIYNIYIIIYNTQPYGQNK